MPNISSLSVDICARHVYVSPHVDGTPMASMQRTNLFAMDSARVIPLGNAISTDIDTDQDGRVILRSFTYTPSLAAMVVLYNGSMEP